MMDQHILGASQGLIREIAGVLLRKDEWVKQGKLDQYDNLRARQLLRTRRTIHETSSRQLFTRLRDYQRRK